MIVNEILGNLKSYDTEGKTIDTVWIDWYEQDKKLLKKNTDSGEEVGIRVSVPLKEGDILYADDRRIVAADILPCELAAIDVETMQEMGRLCFELGNRHLSLSIKEHQVLVPFDEPTFLYLEKLGFHPQKRMEKFSDYTVCHAHGHSHSQDVEHTHAKQHHHEA